MTAIGETHMETIAFIGCGAMGAPIAERLIDAGYTVRLFDPRAEAMAPLVARGGVAATSPRDAATGAEVAFACLPSPEVSRAVAFGAGRRDRRGLAAHLCGDVHHRLDGHQGDRGRTCEEEHRHARLAGQRRAARRARRHALHHGGGRARGVRARQADARRRWRATCSTSATSPASARSPSSPTT